MTTQTFDSKALTLTKTIIKEEIKRTKIEIQKIKGEPVLGVHVLGLSDQQYINILEENIQLLEYALNKLGSEQTEFEHNMNEVLKLMGEFPKYIVK